MRKISLVLLCAALLALLAGCGSEPTLPTLDLYSSSLTGTVEALDGQSCRILVTEGDGHYDTDTQVQVSFSAVDGKAQLAMGDQIRVEYDYVKDVTEYNGLPHITVERISIA